MMEMVRPTTSPDIVRWCTVTSSLPRHRFQINKMRMAKLVVLMPPPVEPGDAPMNMRRRRRRRDGFVRLPISTVLNPAVLGVTD